MTDGIAGLERAPTAHGGLIAWVQEIAALTRPARVYWCDGSQGEREWLAGLLVEQGTFTRLDPGPAAGQLRRVLGSLGRGAGGGSHVHLLGDKEEDAGPTNNWIAPAQMRATLRACSRAAWPGGPCT